MYRVLIAGTILLIVSMQAFSEGAQHLDGKAVKESGTMDHHLHHPLKNVNSTKLKNPKHHSTHHLKSNNQAPDANNEVLKEILETEKDIRKELQWQHQASERKEFLDKEKEDTSKMLSRKERDTFQEGFNKMSEGFNNAVDTIQQFGKDVSNNAQETWEYAKKGTTKNHAAPLMYGTTLYTCMLFLAYYVRLWQL